MTDEDTLLLETTIRDWRSADGCEDMVSPEHLGDFSVKVFRAAYHGLWLEMVNPEGHKVSLLIEAVSGAIKLNSYTPREDDPAESNDEPDARIFLDRAGTLVEEDTSLHPAILRFRAYEPAVRAPGFEEVEREARQETDEEAAVS